MPSGGDRQANPQERRCAGSVAVARNRTLVCKGVSRPFTQLRRLVRDNYAPRATAAARSSSTLDTVKPAA
jgi:hypothetical protein